MGQAEQNGPRHWAVVPAAGSGKRMGADIPKQYLTLRGRTILEHTLQRLAAHPAIDGLVVAISPDDPHWVQLEPPKQLPLYLADGGRERCHSVLNALIALEGIADPQDWVLVHDAARPCVRLEDISALIDSLRDHPVGGLLGLPVADTVKRTDTQGNVQQTVDREGLWRALTPQMFRLGALRRALEQALAQNLLVTDDASAMELTGLAPLMVEGHGDNIKITRPQDLPLAELYLAQQESDK